MKTRKEIKTLVSNTFGLDQITTTRIRKEFTLIANQYYLTDNQHYQSVKSVKANSKEFWESVREFTWLILSIKAAH